MPSKLPDILSRKQETIKDQWIREQLSSSALRSDLLSENELRSQSTKFLDLITAALRTGTLEISASQYEPVRNFLTEISRSRTHQSFSPSETAMFVLSLKQPLFAELIGEYGSDSKSLAAEMWSVTDLLDKLALFTTEVHQQTREEVIRRQQEEMLELSTPVVQLWEGIVALPLIGTLDSARTNVVMETLLQTIVELRSEIAIIDITGVPTVDTLVAQHLLKTVAASRLMGADCIISGIRPQIAQTMVHLQIDLSSVTTKATLSEALTSAMKRLGCTINRNANNS